MVLIIMSILHLSINFSSTTKTALLIMITALLLLLLYLHNFLLLHHYQQIIMEIKMRMMRTMTMRKLIMPLEVNVNELPLPTLASVALRMLSMMAEAITAYGHF